MTLALFLMIWMCVWLFLFEGIPMIIEAVRERIEWGRMRRTHYPKMRY